MKNKLLLLYFLMVVANALNAQTLRGVFIIQSLEGVGDDAKLNDKSKVPTIYDYIYSDGVSLQTLITPGKTTVDTIRRKNEEYGFVQESTVTTVLLEKATIFKNFNKNLFENDFIAGGKETFVKDKIAVYEWVITDDAKTIDGFKCKKATAEYKVLGYIFPIVAWFCEDVPVSDGPIDFNGLPGFILEVSSEKVFSFKFKNFSFNKKETVKIESIKTNAVPKTRKEVENSRN